MSLVSEKLLGCYEILVDAHAEGTLDGFTHVLLGPRKPQQSLVTIVDLLQYSVRNDFFGKNA